jgi:RHS repeat-associated protein
LTYQFSDPHGSATLELNATTLASTQRLFDPFGNPRGTVPSSWPTNRGFVNGVNDTANGLTRLGARDYDPLTGRFISPDQLVDPANPATLNAYAYSNNNPTTMSDPTGLNYTGLMGCPDRDCSVPKAHHPAPPKPPKRVFKPGPCPDNDCSDTHVLTHRPPPRFGKIARQCPDGDCTGVHYHRSTPRVTARTQNAPASPPKARGSISVCSDTSAVAGFLAFSFGGCISADSNGIAFNVYRGHGIGGGLEAGSNVNFVYSTEAANQVNNGTSRDLEFGVRGGALIGGGGDVGISHQSPDQWNVSVSEGAGFDVGLAADAGVQDKEGMSTGYISDADLGVEFPIIMT